MRDNRELVDEMATAVWRHVLAQLPTIPAETPGEDAARRFAQALRAAVLGHRDGARVFSGTYRTDLSVLAQQEGGLQIWVNQGFSLAQVVHAFAQQLRRWLPHRGAGSESGDTRHDYAPETRVERVGAQAHPLVAAAGPEIFSDRDRQFDELVELCMVAISSMRDGGR